MASKKEKEEKKEKPKTIPKFDWESELNNQEIPEHKKDSFRYYINVNNINITSKTDLDKKLKEFEKRNAGE